MITKIANNVAGHRLIDNGRVAEDVTSVSLPTLSHPTSEVKSAGMAMDVNMPDMNHLEACEFSISHNNGVNCRRLAEPGKHFIEVRVGRQNYNAQQSEIDLESIKCRVTCVHVSTEKGSIETGNPYGSTEKYSVLRYEEEVNGEQTVLIDAAGTIKYNGTDYGSKLESVLN